MRTCRTVAQAVSLTLLFLCGWSGSHAQTSCYPNAPPVLDTNDQRVASDIVANSDPDRLESLFNDLLFYAVADAVTLDRVNLRNLKVYQYIGETARTDKQTGSSAKSEGSTSAVEKPGLVQFLGFAIEHGAIQQEVSGTRLTLSTSPYVLFVMADGDTAKTYRDHQFFNRIGAIASFNVADNQSAVLSNVSRKQLTEWSIRVRLIGDRSTRSRKFQDLWERDIKPKIQRRLNVITGAESAIFIQTTGLNGLRKNLLKALSEEISNYLQAHKNESDRTKMVSEVKQIILCKMKNDVFDKIRVGEIQIESSTRDKLATDIVPSLFAAHEDLEQARQLLDTDLQILSKSPLMTFANTNHRIAGSPDYSEFALLYEKQMWSPIALTANAWISVYPHPDPAKKQESVRDFGVAVAFEGKAKSPFLTDTADLSKVTYTFSSRYQRMKENAGVQGKKADIAVAQFKLEIPVGAGVSFPLSVTYANATELIKEREVRGNFGITLDTDKLFALTRRVLKP